MPKFKVVHADVPLIEYTVYGVARDSNNATWFLVFLDDRWLWVPAKHYVPAGA